MGAGLAGVLTRHGITVLTTLDGRSSASQARAREAGMKAVALRELTRADIFLSILPPGEALSFAERFAPWLSQAVRRPLYIDCNAVSPKTLNEIEKVVTTTGARFIDVGIIDPPPKGVVLDPRLYAAGADAGSILSLNQYGIDVRWLNGPSGTASSLKMAYAGITKGLTAVASTMILGATRNDVAEALARELAESEPQMFASLSKRIPEMMPKAYRWIAEMREISSFLADDTDGAGLYSAAAQVYEKIAIDFAKDGADVHTLRRFFNLKTDSI